MSSLKTQVHTAPAHGQDDYQVGIKQGLSLDCQVLEKPSNNLLITELCRPEKMAVIQGKWAMALLVSLFSQKILFNMC